MIVRRAVIAYLAGCVALVTMACGARSGLIVPDDASEPLPALDALDVAADTGRDAPDAIDARDIVRPPDTRRECETDEDCADRIACTRDFCDVDRGVCRREADSSRCDDHLFCTGDEQCVAATGCATTPRNCADSVACTRDSCAEGRRDCVHQPDDALCPISHRCDPMLGCIARALANSRDSLYEIQLPSGMVQYIGSTRTVLTDITLHPDRTLYGISTSALYSLNPSSGTPRFIAMLGGSFDALDTAPDGRIYGAAGGGVFRIDTATGATVRVASFPGALRTSGDLAFLGGTLLATASAVRGGVDDLVAFDLAAGTSRAIGTTGFRCVWGLAAFGTTLYGLTCEGRVLRVDVASGMGTELTRSPLMFYGATAR